MVAMDVWRYACECRPTSIRVGPFLLGLHGSLSGTGFDKIMFMNKAAWAETIVLDQPTVSQERMQISRTMLALDILRYARTVYSIWPPREVISKLTADARSGCEISGRPITSCTDIGLIAYRCRSSIKLHRNTPAR